MKIKLLVTYHKSQQYKDETYNYMYIYTVRIYRYNIYNYAQHNCLFTEYDVKVRSKYRDPIPAHKSSPSHGRKST